MRILVTGASGFVGGAVARALASAGHDVHGLIRSPDRARALAAVEVAPVVGALDTPESYRSTARACDVLVHCAEEHSPRRWEIDRLAVETLLAAAREADARRLVIYTSSVWLYGDRDDERLDEASALRPLPGHEARVDHEQLVRAAREPTRGIVIRPGCVYGGAGSLTAAWFASAVDEGAARIVGDGKGRWAMVHVDDLADLYLRAAESALAGEVLNGVDTARTTVRECAEAASRAAGAGGRVVSTPLADAVARLGSSAQGYVFDQCVDASKASRLLGWSPRHPGFVEGAERYFAAWRSAAAR